MGCVDPVLSAAMGLGWCAARVVYTIGYCRKDKENGSGRTAGFLISSVIELAMIITSGITGYQMIAN